MTFEELRDEVIIGLGGGLVDVELSDQEIMLAFKRAKRTFIQKGNNSYRRCFYRLKVYRDQTTYQIPKDIHTIVKVIKPSFNTYTIDDAFSLATYNDLFGQRNITQGDWLSYELTLQMVEKWRRYMAYDVQFDHDEHRGSVHFLKPPEVESQFWLLECYSNLTDEEYMDNLWIQSWTAAEAKEMLGSAYSKFPSLPGPDGPVSLDGRSLKDEAKQEKERLLEDILNGVDGSDSAWEITFG